MDDRDHTEKGKGIYYFEIIIGISFTPTQEPTQEISLQIVLTGELWHNTTFNYFNFLIS